MDKIELTIDLLKSRLHKEKLVKKKVPVKGKDGKIYYANRWVDPNKDNPSQDTTGGATNGVDAFNNSKDSFSETFDGRPVDPNKGKSSEEIKHEVNLQGEQDTDKDISSLLESEVKNGDNVENDPYSDIDFESISEDGLLEEDEDAVNALLLEDGDDPTYDSLMAYLDEGMDDFIVSSPKDITPTKPKQAEESSGHSTKPTPQAIEFAEDPLSYMQQYGIEGELKDMVVEMSKVNFDRTRNEEEEPRGVYQICLDLAKIVKNHYPSMHPILIKNITSNPHSTEHTKNIQQRIANNMLVNPTEHIGMFNALGMHPGVARMTNDLLYGKELANKMRSEISGGNLTINTFADHLDSIMENGYHGDSASTLVEKDYAKGTPQYDTAMEMLRLASEATLDKKYPKSSPKYSNAVAGAQGFNQLCNINNISINSDRFKVESEVFDITLTDDRPAYLAYNPFASELGGAPLYGDGSVIGVSNSILANCTATEGDSFCYQRAVPRVHGMSHAQDMYMLKKANNLISTMDINPDVNWKETSEDDIDYLGEIPLEFQCHKSIIEPEDIWTITKSEGNDRD